MFGRTEKKIDWERVDQMLMAGCLGTEIAACFDMHPQTFYDRVVKKYNVSFTEYCQEKKGIGDSLLREAQFEKAIKKKDNTMLVWLGKQRLGQKENAHEVSISQELLKPFAEIMNQISATQNSKQIEDKQVDIAHPQLN